jgi:hypothetical protein
VGEHFKKVRFKKCKVCLNKFEVNPFKPLVPVCGITCAITLSKKLKQQDVAKKWRQEKKVMKEKLKTLSDYEKEAKAVFQKWVRQRDAELPCISCGAITDRNDGGHYFDAGMYSGLIFNEWNVNKQCSNYCNRKNHGNKANYRIGLVKKIGEENVLWLEENKNRLRNYKFTKEELIEIKNKYKKLLK